jgi:hypothetical protein
MTISRMTRTLGLVGARAFEWQAWHSPGAQAVEQAVWQSDAVGKARQKPVLVRLWQVVCTAWTAGRHAKT